MDKTAAEKIASEHHDLGIKIAMYNAGLIKEANMKQILKGLGIGTGVGLGGLTAGLNVGHTGLFNPATRKLIEGKANMANDYLTKLLNLA